MQLVLVRNRVVGDNEIHAVRPDDLLQRRHVELLGGGDQRLDGCFGRGERLLRPRPDRRAGAPRDSSTAHAIPIAILNVIALTCGVLRRHPATRRPADPPKLEAPRELLERALLPLNPPEPPPNPPERELLPFETL